MFVEKFNLCSLLPSKEGVIINRGLNFLKKVTLARRENYDNKIGNIKLGEKFFSVIV